MPKHYSPEFRVQAVREVLEKSRAIADVARELEMNSETLRSWVKRSGESPAAPAGESDAVRIARLERENRELRQKTEFLGKAAAFFAKEYR